MNTTPDPKQDPALNPALTRRKETAHDTSKSSEAPVDTASVQRDEGRAWPMIWLIVTVLAVVITIFLIFW